MQRVFSEELVDMRRCVGAVGSAVIGTINNSIICQPNQIVSAAPAPAPEPVGALGETLGVPMFVYTVMCLEVATGRICAERANKCKVSENI